MFRKAWKPDAPSPPGKPPPDPTAQPVAKAHKDTDRDCNLTPAHAKEYGIIDEVLTSRKAQAKLASVAAKAS